MNKSSVSLFLGDKFPTMSNYYNYNQGSSKELPEYKQQPQKATSGYEIMTVENALWRATPLWRIFKSGRNGFKDEYKTTSTTRVGDKSGYTEHQFEERYRVVNFDNYGSASGSGTGKKSRGKNQDGRARGYGYQGERGPAQKNDIYDKGDVAICNPIHRAAWPIAASCFATDALQNHYRKRKATTSRRPTRSSRFGCERVHHLLDPPTTAAFASSAKPKEAVQPLKAPHTTTIRKLHRMLVPQPPPATVARPR
ncbi:hypothetical protein Tsubulata_012077 [Turnera subulata]|uniref:Uncharacterized protein n=1 Tax=Turnera subulata TaxID=218843 RepID=A0A9Q0F4Z0_9ROSI|nr:hypothetical protein Tsubulata_012077 [Turnera subulata]